MPVIQAALLVIIIVFINLNMGVGPRGLRGLAILLIPLYYAVHNLVRQKQLAGNWFIQWKKFWMALILQLMVIGVPACVAFKGGGYPNNLAIPGFVAYFIVTAVAYGASRGQ
ncbi:hypothetical protein ASZ90_017112 [hydrocarbon metagenome]|uniref:Uncharacterized protein n=1 Tax=hydrocarbon metagenome TaxID=938273 RepID=A0A0W8EAD3_9ZZZZ